MSDTPPDDDLLSRMALQSARLDAYSDGDYILDDWEGYHCPECGWNGLSAPMYKGDKQTDADGNLIVTQCPECDEPSPETSDQPTKWHIVVEKLVNGPATVDMGPDDDRE